MLETRFIFIDTSIFISMNYNFNGKIFQRLQSLIENDAANLIIVDIVKREVLSHIEQDIKKCIQELNRFQNKARILKNFSEPNFEIIFKEFEDSNLNENLRNQFENYLLNTNADVLKSSTVGIDIVMDKYFKKQPPFGEGKKKAEFPDAFILLSLENWCDKNDSKIYVVSSDSDMKDYCQNSQNLLAMGKLTDFIELITLHNEKLAPHANEIIIRFEKNIKDAISEEFQEMGFYLEDQQGDVDEVSIDSIEILDRSLLKVDETSAIFEIIVKIDFTAEVTYDDLDTAMYDSEEKVLIPFHQINKTLYREEELSIIITISHNIEDSKYFEIEDIDIDADSSYSLPVRVDDEEYPYK